MAGRKNGRSAKSPAFQWYASDALTDGEFAEMTFEERGAFITLLSYSWLNGGLPEDPERVRRILRATSDEFARFWPAISRCFRHFDGRLVNRRLERERAAQAENRAARKAAADQRWAKQQALAAQQESPGCAASAVQVQCVSNAPVSRLPSPVSRHPSEGEAPPPTDEVGGIPLEPADRAAVQPARGSCLLAGLAMHPRLDTPAVREALVRWEAHRSERGAAPYATKAAEACLFAWERHGPDWLVRASEIWIGKNAKGWFEVDESDLASAGAGGARVEDTPSSGYLEMQAEARARRAARKTAGGGA